MSVIRAFSSGEFFVGALLSASASRASEASGTVAASIAPASVGIRRQIARIRARSGFATGKIFGYGRRAGSSSQSLPSPHWRLGGWVSSAAATPRRPGRFLANRRLSNGSLHPQPGFDRQDGPVPSQAGQRCLPHEANASPTYGPEWKDRSMRVVQSGFRKVSGLRSASYASLIRSTRPEHARWQQIRKGGRLVQLDPFAAVQIDAGIPLFVRGVVR